MKTSLSIFLLFLTSMVLAQTRPNIIVIFTDDQGYADLGVQGSVNDIKTPNLDALATNGVRMTSGYVTAPQCIPSRAGLMTGRYQQRFGTDHNGTIPVPLEEILISQRMSDAGYVTGMTGKWHLEPNHQQPEWIRENIPAIRDKNKYTPRDIPRDKKMPYFPPARGFQEYYYGPMYNILANYDLHGNDIEQQWIEESGFRLDNQTNAAVTFIERNKDKPFFFYLPYFAPHVPLEATEKYLSRFPGDMPERRRYCLAMMAAIDDGVGKITETLKANGIYENTLIFFISDNGAPLKIDKKDIPLTHKGGAWDGSLNDPWVGEKGMISEGGIRVPFLMSWPAVLPKGKVYDRPVISLDMAATAVELASGSKPKELDGTNLIPFLTGEKEGDPHEALYWRFWDQAAIREGNFKYLSAGEREFLFDVSTEEHETKNLIDEYPKKAKSLRKKLDSWAKELKNPGIPEGPIGSEKRWYDHYFQF
ncbi:sulfatase family protein [Marinoscillum furvescens]|uniref:Arylsulfatase A-like enzyme n=1 Tax=Marinoscillum furvescens DSM 4134 TaxID=1122208 RepID=A0A3D9KYJ6_MARFU|nr:sulfatase-like hydrolase/transferase [Marinoscillum furvescens]RED94671.1 arylsulfatase A-like enzyme [Marinoscillum furvescens DSM 4134]